MKNNAILCLLLFISISCLGQHTIDEEIEKLFRTQLEKESIKSAFLHIHSKTNGIDIQLADSKINSEDSISTNNPFYTASITKMLTASSIGNLQDLGKLNFDDKIVEHLPELLTEHLHVMDGKEYSKDITIAHLLQHTSGLPDYFTDTTIDESPNIINQLLIDTNKSWSPQEMILFTKEKMKPHFVPGQGYHYTDTEYVLLALIIEKISGITLHEFFQRFIFQPLEMNSSYINLKSSPINTNLKIADFYVGDIELSSFKSLSADWGGGGLVSTTRDLIQFFKAYNEDKIIKKETRLQMQNWMHETIGMQYGFGIRKVSFKDLLNIETDIQLIGHTGSTAAFLWYCPQLDTYVAGTLNQLEASKSTLNLVYDILKTIEKKS